MLRKIAKFIFNNIGLKILAAVLALVFWMIILNIEDPDKTKVFTVEVEIENEEYLTEMGKTYEVINNSGTISFTATGRRSIIESLEASDFKVTADLEDIVNMSEVPISITAKRYSGSLDISNKTQYLELNVEDLVTVTFDVEAQTSGEMDSDYSVSGMSVSPETISVEGPESVVEQIASVVALVDITSMKDDFEQEAAISLYDADGEEVSTDRLTLNHSTVTVSVSVIQTKTVSLVFETSGTPPDGSRVLSVSGSIEEVSVQGRRSILQDIDSITVDGTELRVTDLEETVDVEIDLTDYLPSGVTLESGDDAAVTVTIEIENTVEETFEMSTSNIEVTNLADGLVCTMNEETVSVTLEGYASELAAIDASELTGSVDMSELEEGDYAMLVTLDGDYTLAKVLRVSLTVSEEETSDEESEGDE